jgi:hypothetical protein
MSYAGSIIIMSLQLPAIFHFHHHQMADANDTGVVLLQ